MSARVGISRKQVPLGFVSTQAFPQKSTFAFACVALSFPMLVVLLVFVSLVGDLSRGQFLPADEWVPAVVVLAPLLLWTVPFFLRQRSQRRDLSQGTPSVGAFFSDDALLWCVRKNLCHYLPKGSLRSVYIQGRISRSQPGGLGVCYPDWMELRGTDFTIRIPGASEYHLRDLVDYFKRWSPDVAITTDPRSNWFGP